MDFRAEHASAILARGARLPGVEVARRGAGGGDSPDACRRGDSTGRRFAAE